MRLPDKLMIRIQHFAALFTLCVGLAAPGVQAQDKPVTLRFAHTQPESDSQHIGAVEFAKQVEARTKGQVKINIFPSGQLGNDNALVAGVRSGTIDIGMTGNPFLTGMSPELNVLDLPYLFTDEKHAYGILDGEVGRSLLDSLDRYQLKGLAFWEIGFRSLANSRRPVQTADDIAGLKIRTTPNPAHIKVFQLLGANPQPLAYTELFSALESGAVDGHENPPTLMLSSKVYETQPYLSLTNHAYTASVVFMNKNLFDRLSEENRKILVEEALAAGAHQREISAKNQDAAVAELEKHGVKVNRTPDIEGIRERVRKPVHDEFVAKYGDKHLKAILEATP